MEEEKVRLFVGGLSAGVSAVDLQERFAPLGNVQNITLPPAKAGGPGHRGFAYVDFVPKTDASLRKLFSAYNGCKWRGGKLRIEKAAEHYSDKLHREWAVEAASLTIDSPAKEIEVVQKSSLSSGWQKQVNGANKGDMEATDLKIFFPRLRKLKDVPLTGLGKHKRSFQRFEACPLQLLSYCGCAESLRFGSCKCSNINGGWVPDTSSLKQDTGGEKDDISQALEIERQRQLDLVNRLFPADSTSTSLENQKVVELDDIEEKRTIQREFEQVSKPEVVKVEKKRKLDAPAKSLDLVETVKVGPRGTTTEPSRPLGKPTLSDRSGEEASKWAALAEMCQFRTEEIMQPEGSKQVGNSVAAAATSNKDEDVPSTEVSGVQVVEASTISHQQGTSCEKDDISQAVEIERQRQLDLVNRLFLSDSTSTSLENQKVVELGDIEEKGIIQRESEQVLQPEVVKAEKKRKLGARAKSVDLVETVKVGPRGTTTEPSMPLGKPTLSNRSAEEASKWAALAEMCQFRTEEIMQPEGSKQVGNSVAAAATSNKDEDVPSTEVSGVQVVEARTISHQQGTSCEKDDVSQAVEIERQRQLDLVNRLFPSDSTSTSLENQKVVELDDIEEKRTIQREFEQVSKPEVVKVEKKRKLDAPAKSLDLVETVKVGPRGTTTEPSRPLGKPTLSDRSGEEASKWAALAEMCQFRTEDIMRPEGSELEENSMTEVATSNKDEDVSSTEVPGFQVVEASPTSQQHTEAENNRVKSDDPSTSGQKLTRAAWKSLVGETGRVVFSLRQLTGLSLLPETPSLTQETQTIVDAYTPAEPSLSFKASNHNQAKSKVVSSSAQKKQVGVRFSTQPKIEAVELPKTSVTPIVSSSDVCPFMKSDNAEKDWLATKSDLRSDYRAKQKYAARNDKKLWGKR